MNRALRGLCLLLAFIASSSIAQNWRDPSGSQVGRPVVGGTDTRILYACGSPVLVCDSASLTYNNSTKRFTVGTGSGTSAGLTLGNKGTNDMGIWPTGVSPTSSNYILGGSGAGATAINGTTDVYITISDVAKMRQVSTAGAGPFIIAGTAADNTGRALSISQGWTDGTTDNIGIVGNFDMGATGTATGKLLSLQAGAAGTTEVLSLSQGGTLTLAQGIAASGDIQINTSNGFYFAAAIAIRTAPTIASGGCTNAAMANNNGTARFEADVGTSCSGSQPLVFTLPAATIGWNCTAQNVTNPATSAPAQTNAVSTTSVTITNFVRTTGVAGAWTDGDNIVVSCLGG